jgi:hypothetical protein
MTVFLFFIGHIDHYAWVTLETYLPVKRIGNKFLKIPRQNDRYTKNTGFYPKITGKNRKAGSTATRGLKFYIITSNYKLIEYMIYIIYPFYNLL